MKRKEEQEEKEREEQKLKEEQEEEQKQEQKQEKKTEQEEKPGKPEYKTLHENIVCDGCCPSYGLPCASGPTCSKEGFILGPRFKCLYCHNYDLCAECESREHESDTHRKYHNMIKINAPDGHINELWRRHRHGSGSPLQRSAQDDAFSIKKSSSDVIIDIPERQAGVFDFFSKIKDEAELTRVVEHYKKYATLLELVGGDEPKIKKAVGCFDRLDGLQRSQTTEVVEQELVEVEMDRKDHLVAFKLHNRGSYSIPNGLRLVFQYFEADGVSSTKCNLHMGPHELQPDNYKILNFNYRGLIQNFCLSNRCQIDLIDHDEQVVFTGTSGGNQTFFLRPPMLHHIQESVYLEARETTVTASASDNSDGDIISTTATNDEDEDESSENIGNSGISKASNDPSGETRRTRASSYDSEMEDYDFLSDFESDM